MTSEQFRKEAEKQIKEEKVKIVVEKIKELLKLKELKQKELDDVIKSVDEVIKKGLSGVTIEKGRFISSDLPLNLNDSTAGLVINVD